RGAGLAVGYKRQPVACSPDLCNNAGVNVNRSLARPIYATTPNNADKTPSSPCVDGLGVK
ncbi:MAG: hypothetical protein VB135_04625, partial [Burkholderia sp.]